MPIPSAELKHPVFGNTRRIPTRVAIRWRAPGDEGARRTLLDGQGLARIELGSAGGDARPVAEINDTDLLWWAQSKDGRPIPEDTLAALERDATVEWISAVYQAVQPESDERTQFTVNPTIMGFAPPLATLLADTETSGEMERAGIALIADPGVHRHMKGCVFFRIRDQGILANNALTVLSFLQSTLSARGRSVSPSDFILENVPLMSPECAVRECAPAPSELLPNDRLFGQQWNLRQIEATRAWNLSMGDPSITVAVIDQGVDLTHPDLLLHPDSWNCTTDQPNGSPTGNHGTACAGIVAARSGNSLGVAGVAGRCRIMAIATATWSDLDIAEGLYFAADHGARVVSMSFGVYSGWGWNLDVVRAALQYASERGLVLVAAGGNENQAVSRFPGSDGRTICVGGTNRDDQRKRIGDTSGESWWGACYGPDLDVCAPCLEIPTTDRQGAAGYNGSPGPAGDYYPRFNGTSAATPHVAGLAALILSLRPDLSAGEVREIVETTCDKVSPSLYGYALTPGKIHGTWNNEVGYGRINAERAMLMACAYGQAESDSPCGGALPREDPRCVGPEAPPWLPYDPCLRFYDLRLLEDRTLKGYRIQIRVIYEHCLQMRGRKQGQLLYTLTLLPGEELRLYQFERYRRTRSAKDTYSVHTSFRQYVSALSQTRRTQTQSQYQSVLETVRADGDTDLSVGGSLFPVSREAKDHDTVVSQAMDASVRTVADEFHQVVVTASQSVDVERSVVVSDYEDKEELSTTARLVRNENKCRAVTYFVRKVLEVYHLSTHVTRIEYRVLGPNGQSVTGYWRSVDDLGDLPDAVKQVIRNMLQQLPAVGQSVGIEREIVLPTDGTLYETELAHCCSCEPLRMATHLADLQKLRAEARRTCAEAELAELEAKRRQLLLGQNRLDPFETPQGSVP